MGQFSKELQICLSTPIDKQSVHHISYARTWLLHLDLDANAFFVSYTFVDGVELTSTSVVLNASLMDCSLPYTQRSLSINFIQTLLGPHMYFNLFFLS